MGIKKSVLIIGSSGQDGQVLRKVLENEDASIFQRNRNIFIDPSGSKIVDSDTKALKYFFNANQIDEVYFLAATNFSASQTSHISIHTEAKIHLDLLLNELIELLEVIQKYSPLTRIFFASSALIFGDTHGHPQDETTKSAPGELYSLFKVICQEVLLYFRNTFGLFIVIGILYPHESELRKPEFLFPKIIHHAYAAKTGELNQIQIADLEFKREWNCAYQVMLAGLMTLRLNDPDDYVIGSGTQYSVLDICSIAFSQLNLDYTQFVVQSNQVIRNRNSNLIANSKKLYNAIGYKPDGDAHSLIQRVYTKLGYL